MFIHLFSINTRGKEFTNKNNKINSNTKITCISNIVLYKINSLEIFIRKSIQKYKELQNKEFFIKKEKNTTPERYNRSDSRCR